MSISAALKLQTLEDQPAEATTSAGLPASEDVARLVATLSTRRAAVSAFPASLRPGQEAGAPIPVPEAEPTPAASVSRPGPVAGPAATRRSRRGGTRWVSRLATGLTVAGAASLLFLSIGPMLLPFQVFSVLSGSMSPGIPTGSMVVVSRAAAGDLKVGDIITFAPPGRSAFVSHRIYSMDSSSGSAIIETKGDANSAPDPWRLNLNGSGWRYLFSVPFAGYALVFAKSALGRLALVLVPGLGLGVLYLVEQLRPRSRPA